MVWPSHVGDKEAMLLSQINMQHNHVVASQPLWSGAMLASDGALQDVRDKAKTALDLLLVAARPVLMHGSREEAGKSQCFLIGRI